MPTTGEVATAIQNVGERLRQQMVSFGWSLDQPFNQLLGGFHMPINAKTLTSYADMVAARVARLSKQQLDLDGFGVWLGKLIPQLDQIQFNALNQGQIQQISNALIFLQMIDAGIPTLPPKEPKVNWEDIKDEKTLLPRDLKTRLRSVATRLDDLEPRSNDLAAKIADIENAHETANLLPTDLAELKERKVELETLLSEAKEMVTAVEAASDRVVELEGRARLSADAADARIAQTDQKAGDLIGKSEQALRGATSVGLSRSFSERKDSLSSSGWYWTVGLILSLLVAVGIGWERVSSLKEVLDGSRPATVILVNAILAVLGIGAPVWFAWLSTKQIGTIFRLAEDYAFKASVAQAYEGYRSEAVNIDEKLRERLFASALDRFEEAPIRLIDPNYHSSPLQELMGNPAIRKALEQVPGIADKIVQLIPVKGGKVAAVAIPAAAVGSTFGASSGGQGDPENT